MGNVYREYVMTATSRSNEDLPGRKEEEFQRQTHAESLAFLYRTMPGLALGQSVAALLVALALAEAAAMASLLGWCFAIIGVSLARVGLTRLALSQLAGLDAGGIRRWSWFLLGMTFLQACCWGAAPLLLWADDIGYRAFLVAVLAGIIAAGGITLALHKSYFWMYCLPIVVPTIVQLLVAGSRLELLLAGLLTFYVVLLHFGVARLTRMFQELLRLRLLMQDESRTDALTGLANRRRFDERLDDVWQQSMRSAQPVGLLVIDIDFFKRYNDYYGHPEGDRALKQVSKLLRQAASRSIDLCARIGGEEFAVVLPVTDLHGSRQVAETLSRRMVEARLPHGASEGGYLTVSVGVHACWPAQGDCVEEFVAAADAALYEAKRLGRGRVVAAGSG